MVHSTTTSTSVETLITMRYVVLLLGNETKTGPYQTHPFGCDTYTWPGTGVSAEDGNTRQKLIRLCILCMLSSLNQYSQHFRDQEFLSELQKRNQQIHM